MNYNHKIKINWSCEGRTFLAHVPELQGCITEGNSFAEAMENVQLLIDQVIMEELFQTKHFTKRTKTEAAQSPSLHSYSYNPQTFFYNQILHKQS